MKDLVDIAYDMNYSVKEVMELYILLQNAICSDNTDYVKEQLNEIYRRLRAFILNQEIKESDTI